jgi:hypothetical protein
MNEPVPSPTPLPAPVSIETEMGRRVLWIHFRGVVLPGHFGTFAHELERSVSVLGRGFTLVTDLTGLESMDLDCVPHVTRAMDLFLVNGIAKVIRIIPDPDKDIGLKLLSIVHYRGRVPTFTCETRAEAEREVAAFELKPSDYTDEHGWKPLYPCYP